MSTRQEKIKELMESFHSLRRHHVFRAGGSGELPHVTPSQWGVLLYIKECEETTVKGVASALGVTSSAATQLIDGLVDNGHVVRKTSATDRRAVSLVLSKKVKLQVVKMKRHVLQKFIKLFEVLDDKEFNQYLALNKKIVDRFSKNKKI